MGEQLPQKCEHCTNIDFAKLYESSSKIKITHKQHPSLESPAALSQNAKNCPCCAFLHREWQAAIRRTLDRAGACEGPANRNDTGAFAELQHANLILWAKPSSSSLQSHIAGESFKRLQLASVDEKFEDYSALMRIATSRERGTKVYQHVPPHTPSWLTPKTIFHCHVVENKLDASSVKDIVDFWNLQCLEGHAECRNQDNCALPDRILQVGTLQEPSLSLLETHNEPENYLALSYCWGIKVQVMTLTRNIEEFKTSIDETTLPATIRDAIEVTRALGVCYLWVDSLCIIQDCAADWDLQSAKMASVYGNAYLTLCVSRAASVHDGFLGSRFDTPLSVDLVHEDGEDREVYLIPETWTSQDIQHKLLDTPLGGRGWCVQERLMSPRKIYFHEQQLIWECQERFFLENGLETLAGRGEMGNTVVEEGTEMPEDLFAWDNDLFTWDNKGYGLRYRISTASFFSIVEAFTACKLTKNTDRLPAISAIAEFFVEQLRKRNGAQIEPAAYIAGHWQSQFVRSLMWRVHIQDPSRVSQDGHVAPSWSWASVIQPVKFLTVTTIEFPGPIYSDLDYHVEVAGVNDFGNVKEGGWMSIKAPLFKATCKFSEEGPLELVLIGGRTLQTYPVYEGVGTWESGVYLDDPSRHEDLFVLVLFPDLVKDDELFHGLLLRSEGSDFKRVGTFWKCKIGLNDGNELVDAMRQVRIV